jgi:hypothetical protein
MQSPRNEARKIRGQGKHGKEVRENEREHS